MPYISQDKRDRIFKKFSYDPVGPDYNHIDLEEINTPGDIQYAIAVIIKQYLFNKNLRYQLCNDVMGALAGAQMEFYRRTVIPYEDKKIEENGDV